MVAAFVLMGAPYGQEPQVIQEVANIFSGEASLSAFGRAGFHAMFVPWLLFSFF